jgi:hypothetical protein
MSFLRTKIINGTRYHYEVENYREDGKIRQRTLRYLGKVKESDEWYTPDTPEQPILTLVVKVLGRIDLDPCSNAKRTVPAAKHFTLKEDGLIQPWRGRIFMNPPYSKPLPWVKRLIEFYLAGEVPEAIALLKAGCESNRGTGKLLNHAAAVARWDGRIQFIPSRAIDKNRPDFDTAFFYFGNNVEYFKAVFQPYCHRIRL